jgi:hypothetical protein
MASQRHSFLFVIAALLHALNAVVLCCSLDSQTQVPWFAAFKPPKSYSLYVVAWLNGTFVNRESRLTSTQNPVFSTLKPIFKNAGAQYMGALQANKASKMTNSFALLDLGSLVPSVLPVYSSAACI